LECRFPSEQRIISAALREADALFNTLDQLIAKKREVKTGAMQAFLTRADAVFPASPAIGRSRHSLNC